MMVAAAAWPRCSEIFSLTGLMFGGVGVHGGWRVRSGHGSATISDSAFMLSYSSDMDTKNLKPLINALDVGYRYRSHEMLGFFLSATMSLWGLPEWQPVPEDVQPNVQRAIEAYADIVSAETPFCDILGPTYMELASNGARFHLGQYFTPWPVAEMMAKISSGSPVTDKADGLVRICDPACGSGVMLLAYASEVLLTQGPEALSKLSLTGCDIDPICARMFAVQAIASCNIHSLQLGECLIYRGNSLGPWNDLEVIIHATAPSVAKEPSALAQERLLALATAAKSHPDVMQLQLFAA